MNELANVPDTPAFLQNAMQTFEGVQQLAEMMAKVGTMPDHLKNKPGDCFLIVAQAATWGMNPFAVAQCTSVVHGRLCLEGKLVHAVLMSMGAIKGTLDFELSGEERSDKRSIVVTGTLQNGQQKSITGTVADWKTAGNGSPWKPGQYDQMLRYRGAREWARAYAPHALLGVYTPDEVAEVVTKETTAEVREERPSAFATTATSTETCAEAIGGPGQVYVGGNLTVSGNAETVTPATDEPDLFSAPDPEPVSLEDFKMVADSARDALGDDAANTLFGSIATKYGVKKLSLVQIDKRQEVIDQIVAACAEAGHAID